MPGGEELRCWRRVILVVVAMTSAACAGRGSGSGSPQEPTTIGPSESAGSVVTPESSRGDGDSGSSWLPTRSDDELVAFVRSDGRSVAVGSADGRIIGVANFAVPVEVEGASEANRIAVRGVGGARLWIVDTSTGQTVEEIDGVANDGVISSGDGRFRAEVVDGDIDGKGSVTFRESGTGSQTFYTSIEPGWILADSGVAFARSSDLAAVPTSSTSSNEQALMVVSAASGALVAFSGPEAHRFLGWVGSSCWLSATAEAVVTHCVDGERTSSEMEVDSTVVGGGDLGVVDPEHASIQRPGPLALSLMSGREGDRRLVLLSPTTGAVEIGSGSFPRWSPSGRYLAVITTTGLLVLDPGGTTIATYDDATGPPAWTTPTHP